VPSLRICSKQTHASIPPGQGHASTIAFSPGHRIGRRQHRPGCRCCSGSGVPGFAGARFSTNPILGLKVSILVYHRFGPIAKDAMTVRTATLRPQLDYLRQHGHPIVPLKTVVSYLLDQGPPPPPRCVVITADDGYESIFKAAGRPPTPIWSRGRSASMTTS
jgi:hypothetical protein